MNLLGVSPLSTAITNTSRLFQPLMKGLNRPTLLPLVNQCFVARQAQVTTRQVSRVPVFEDESRHHYLTIVF